ncbi:unnamed protein product [Victoria cruziana]
METTQSLHYLLSCFLIIVFLTSYQLPLSSSLSSTSFTVKLMHADAHMNLTYQQHIHAAIRRTHHRAIHQLRRTNTRQHHHPNPSTPLPRQATSLKMPLQGSQAEYLMMLAIGTPPTSIPAVIDTGSTLIWAMCYQPPNRTDVRVFDPQSSSSYSTVPCSNPICNNIHGVLSRCKGADCNYLAMYADMSYCTGILGWETFTLGSMTLNNVGFGCSSGSNGFQSYGAGVVGFNRASSSLISQLGSMVDHQFSYCLAGFNAANQSVLTFGPNSHSTASNDVAVSTPLLVNPVYPEQYFVALLGISVAGKRLPVPDSIFQFRSDGSGGVIVDSGSTFTGLVQELYSLLKEAFVKETGKPSLNSTYLELDTCFHGLPHSISIPTLTFHFEGVDLCLPFDNYIVIDPKDQLSCLAILPSPVDMNIIGATTQQNFLVHFDLGKDMISFTPAQCTTL